MGLFRFCTKAASVPRDNFLNLMQENSTLLSSSDVLSLKTKTGYEELSYAELLRFSKNFANYLIGEIGVKRNDRVAILSESRPEFAIGMFASIQAGAIAVPLDIKLTINELSNILSDCNPKILFYSSKYFETAVQLKANIESIEQIFILENEKPDGCGCNSIFDISPEVYKNLECPRPLDDTALIIYTSGTTGNSKGVMISFGNLYSQMLDFNAILSFKRGSTAVSVLPLNHLLELSVGLFGALYMGVKIIYMQTLSPKELANVMREKHITVMLVVPSVVKMIKAGITREIKKQTKLLQAGFSFMYQISKYLPRKTRRLMFSPLINKFGGKFDCFICGGAWLDLEIEEFFERIGIPIYQGYGLTEAGPTVSTNYPKHNKIGTAGKPLPSFEVKIAFNGEILVKGPGVMQGYYGESEMSTETIDKDGWLHTGDIGEIDSDGYLSITGRLKSIIVLSDGKKVFPEEVEAALEKSLLIKELCVLALKTKTGKKAGEEKVGVVVIPDDDLSKKTDEEIQKTLEEEIKILSAKSLALYKHPALVIISKQPLPKTSTQKIKRQELLEWYEKGLF